MKAFVLRFDCLWWGVQGGEIPTISFKRQTNVVNLFVCETDRGMSQKEWHAHLNDIEFTC